MNDRRVRARRVGSAFLWARDGGALIADGETLRSAESGDCGLGICRQKEAAVHQRQQRVQSVALLEWKMTALETEHGPLLLKQARPHAEDFVRAAGALIRSVGSLNSAPKRQVRRAHTERQKSMCRV